MRFRWRRWVPSEGKERRRERGTSDASWSSLLAAPRFSRPFCLSFLSLRPKRTTSDPASSSSWFYFKFHNKMTLLRGALVDLQRLQIELPFLPLHMNHHPLIRLFTRKLPSISTSTTPIALSYSFRHFSSSMAKQEPKIVKVAPIEGSKAKFVELKQITYEDEDGKEVSR